MNPTLKLRTFPLAEFPFLRYQVGFSEKRPAQHPVYGSDESNMVMSEQPCEHHRVEVFRLKGFGETEAAARKMARESEMEPAIIEAKAPAQHKVIEEFSVPTIPTV